MVSLPQVTNKIHSHHRMFMFVNRLFDETHRSGWRRLLRLWRPMAGWTLLIWIAFGLILGPVYSGALSRAVLRGDRILIGNEELLAWLFRPEGLAYVTLAATLILVGGVIRFAGLFHILTEDLVGKPPTVRRVLVTLLPDSPSLFRLSFTAVVAALVLVAPLLACVGAIYVILLGEHDINYYLYARPPEWRYAIWSVVLVAIPWAVVAGYLVLRSLPTLPAFLDGHRPARVALVRSWATTKRQVLRLLKLLLVCLGAWFLARLAAHAILFFVAVNGLEILAGTISSIVPILLATGAYALTALALDACLSFFGFSFFAVVLCKFYYEDTDLHAIAPQVEFGLKGMSREALSIVRSWLRPVRMLPLAAILLLLSGSVSGWFLQKVAPHDAFQVTAHRAGAFYGPENTLVALEASIEAGADFAEIDVQRLRDGTILVIHDADLMRMAGDPRRVTDLTYAEVSGVTLGADDDGPEELRGLATLDEFLERSRGRIGLNIELKYYGWDPQLAPAVFDLIREHDMEDEVLLMSLSLRAVKQLRDIAPGIPLGFVASITIGNLQRLPVDFIAVPRQVATPRLIRAAEREGMEVHVWTLNRPDTMLDAVQRGARAIITDDPVLAVKIRRELAELTTVERILLAFRGLVFHEEAYDEPLSPYLLPSEN